MPVIEFPRAGPEPPYRVRVRQRRPDGFVEFDLSVGDPVLCAELILPAEAFETFCRDHRVQPFDTHTEETRP